MVCKLRVLASDRWKMSFSSQLDQFEWNVVPFGIPGSSSLIMRVANQVLTVGLDFFGDTVPQCVQPGRRLVSESDPGRPGRCFTVARGRPGRVRPTRPVCELCAREY